MAMEIEAKFRVATPEAVRAHLRRAGGRRHGRMLEHNRIFDTAARQLLGKDCGLRLRRRQPLDAEPADPVASAAVLTFKGPRLPGPPKTREELETEVADGKTCAAILNRLGFREVVVYETRRETWSLAGCMVTLDELPHLGTWVEIEGPDEDAIDRVRDRIHLDPEAMVHETYVEMAATAGVADATGCRRLVFAGSAACPEP